MPETQESKASYLVLKHVLASLNNKGTSMALESIEIDATDNKSSRLPRDHPARQGLPYAIDSSSTVKWGTNKSQTFVYPEMWRTGGKAKSNMPVRVLANLSLEGIQWLTHMSIQLYSRTVYEMLSQCFWSAARPVPTTLNFNVPSAGMHLSPKSLFCPYTYIFASGRCNLIRLKAYCGDFNLITKASNSDSLRSIDAFDSAKLGHYF
ncbi:hypothetical protein DFH08DRAFT_825789 [Mycena albidolilacea]|uniref:Uncharacterized protein n=1 Tax=Mycena albidolilacea TaxID=1033008 RepID=A0AAD6Z1W3_9AGAR|nr:hypothetical protein DFH08DRAFT_825789 [Mycena albidolilacea]